jgi:LmbE family N-acetylglucosaminyl deacetylase
MPTHVLCIGAHPDDVEGSIGGTAALLSRRGDVVHVVSVTNGNKGHYAPQYIADPSSLAARRRVEAQKAAAVIGARWGCMDVPDGEVYLTQAATEAMVRLIRTTGQPGHGPDLVLFNRPNDYHRDHRYAAQLVLDATYMLTVPMLCPDTPHLSRMPVFAYWQDRFTEPTAFRVDVAVGIDEVIEQKLDMMTAHESQYFEWLAYNNGTLDRVPAGADGRRAMIGEMVRRQGQRIRQMCGDRLPATVRHAEAFQISEYGRRPSAEELLGLFGIAGRQ